MNTSAKSAKVVGNLLRRTGYTLTRVTPRTNLVCQHIPGWFSVREAEALYFLAATAQASRFLEVGHFLGRSTSAICEGIRDAGAAVEFNSYDLGFRNSDDFVAHYKRVHNTTSTQVPEEFEELVFAEGKTTTEIARSHLGRFGLTNFVKLISGDFTKLDSSRYGFIFCDALHDEGEIRANLPCVIQASNPGCVWAFHDMTPDNIEIVMSYHERCGPRAHGAIRLIKTIDTLGVFRFT
jgi:hypothetical protein